MKKIYLFILLFFICKNVYAIENVDLTKNATSSIMIEPSTKEVIYRKNEHEKRPPASMTKMMSLLIIMEQIDKGNISLEDKVITSSYASSMGGSQIFLKPNEVMKVSDLLKGIAIASGNDATVAMAEKIAGTEEMFVKLMNEKARAMGLKNTNFKNSTGLDATNHYSSAYDMAMIARELISHKEILKYTSTYEDYLRKGTKNPFWLVNTNKLVRFYKGADGLKTGFTTQAGYCLTATAKKDNMRLITVVMNEPSSKIRNSETISLLDYGFNMYSLDKILDNNTSIKKGKVELGKKELVDLVPTKSINILNNNSSKKRIVKYDYVLNKIKAPVKVGDIVGKIEVKENNKVINTIDITVKENIDKANFLVIYYRNLKRLFMGI